MTATPVQRPERDDHPFDPQWSELFLTRRLSQRHPNDAELAVRSLRAQAVAELALEPVLSAPLFARLCQELRWAKRSDEELRFLLLRDTRTRVLAPNEVAVQQGEYGTSAFVVLEGAVEVRLEGLPPPPRRRRARGPLKALWSWLTSPGDEVRDLDEVGTGEALPEAVFLQDLPGIVRPGRRVALGPGELFGEISALGRVPRTATVAAGSKGARLLEIRWQGLRDLRAKFPLFRRLIEETYRRNVLEQHLLATPFLADIGDTPAIRGCLESSTAKALKTLFCELLGWEPLGKRVQIGSLHHRIRVLGLGPHAGLTRVVEADQLVLIGRSGHADLCLGSDPALSREHAIVFRSSTGYVLRNLSRHGSVVGEVLLGRKDEAALLPGRVARLSRNTSIVYEIKDASSQRVGQGELLELARSRADGPGAITVFLCPGEIPPEVERRRIEAHVRARSTRYVLIYGAGHPEQHWQWSLRRMFASASGTNLAALSRQAFGLPEDEDAQGELRVTGGGVEELIQKVVRPLAREEVAQATELRYLGKYEWSRRTPQERSEGTPWDRWADDESILVREGQAAHGVYLLRAGFLRIASGERTQGYLGKGGALGLEEARQTYRARQTDPQAPPAPFAASASALGYAELLYLPSSLLFRLVPGWEAEASDPPPCGEGSASETLPEGFLKLLVDRRLINGTQAMVIDLEACTRCDDCVKACAATHEHNPRFVREGTRYRNLLIAQACMHCADPVCMIGCPTGAIRRAPTGEVRIRDETCIGCETCASNCPYDNIRMVQVRDARGLPVADAEGEPVRRATKCDLCHGQGEPACVQACAQDALIRVDLTDLERASSQLRRT